MWQFPPLLPGSTSLPTMSSDEYSAAWADMASGCLGAAQMNLDFDPQEFFNDYMFTGELFSSMVRRPPQRS